MLSDQQASKKPSADTSSKGIARRTKLLIDTLKASKLIRATCYTLASDSGAKSERFQELLSLRATGSELLRHVQSKLDHDGGSTASLINDCFEPGVSAASMKVAYERFEAQPYFLPKAFKFDTDFVKYYWVALQERQL